MPFTNKEMKLVHSISEMQKIRSELGSELRVGFVPTMGYLHEGHLSLVAEANRQSDITIVSIYVNPAQFGPNEDFAAYPRDLDHDLELLSRYKVDYVFFPVSEEMYPEGFKTRVEVQELSDILCGASRPGHFSGVATVVLKLVNIVRPNLMFMGSKDFQQVTVLKTMLRDLNLDTQIVACPIVREADGLALSSRNIYLDAVQRQQALCLSQALTLIRKLYLQGSRDTAEMISAAKKLIERSGGKVDYLTIVDANSLETQATADDSSHIVMAVYIGRTRLIDNSSILA